LGVNHYKVYLLEREFIVRTDHAALRYLHTFSDNNARLMRWSLRLAEYQFWVEHRPGTQMKRADILSRCVQKISLEEPLTKERTRREQREDKFCKYLKIKASSHGEEYFLDQEGVIYKRRCNGEHRVLVPQSLIEKVVTLSHNPIYAGHPGQKRMVDTVALRYWLPKMKQDIIRHVNGCNECVK
jgi:hypothetical protein